MIASASRGSKTYPRSEIDFRVSKLTAPKFAISGHLPIASRIVDVIPDFFPCSIAIRCDPTPIAKPSSQTASAKCRLIRSARSGPPVIELTKSGADSLYDRNWTERSMS